MKILHTVESYLPSRHGMSEVVRQISERLVSDGHQVTVATRADPTRVEKIINGVEIIEFDISGNITTGMQGEYDRYIRYLLDSDFDVVTNFAAQQWATDLALPILQRIRGKKVFVPTGFSALYMPQYKSYFERMKDWLKQYDKVVYLSDDYRDVNFARELGLTNGILIPNGASEEEFSCEIDPDFKKRLGIPEENFLILHVSGYIGSKGHLDAIRIFRGAQLKNTTLLFVSPDFGDKFVNFKLFSLQSMKSILKSILSRNQPLEDVQLVLIHHFQKIGLFKNIRFVELARSDVVQAYKTANLFLFPSNIECSPIVLFECMATGTPFLVTDVGNAKEIIQWSEGGQLLPTKGSEGGYGLVWALVKESSNVLKIMASDQVYLHTLSKNGTKAWKNNFTWGIISKKYSEMYRNLIN
jgi:L-malate glycosyltransferase